MSYFLIFEDETFLIANRIAVDEVKVILALLRYSLYRLNKVTNESRRPEKSHIPYH